MMIQTADLQRQCKFLNPEIDATIQNTSGSSRSARRICQICDVINHAS